MRLVARLPCQGEDRSVGRIELLVACNYSTSAGVRLKAANRRPIPPNMKGERMVSAVLKVCCECALHADCELDDCTATERQQALAATRRVREEQRNLLAQLSPQR